MLLFAVIWSAGCGVVISNWTSTVTSTSPIQHVVVVMQENRSFDNLFHGFPGADSADSGLNRSAVVQLSPVPLAEEIGLLHTHTAWWQDWDNGKMDGFAEPNSKVPLYAYSYVRRSDIEPYWNLATQYTLADRMFQSNSGPSFVAHQYMIAGQSGTAAENPKSDVWGCDAPEGTTVATIGPNGIDGPGIFPCFDYKTMADLLDVKGVTWRYYAPANTSGSSLFSAYEAIRHIFYGLDWKRNVVSPQTKVLTDIASGKLAQVTWIVPDWAHSDVPGNNSSEGPDWVASIVNAIGTSKFWNSTAILITWDDWGGWYDHVPPHEIDEMGPGFRVPLIVVSPYAKRGYVSHQVYETASLLKYTETVFALPSLGVRDASTNDLMDCFDYTQSPLPFTAIQTRVRVETLMQEAPSGSPDDD